MIGEGCVFFSGMEVIGRVVGALISHSKEGIIFEMGQPLEMVSRRKR